jgi:hypothetical protein
MVLFILTETSAGYALLKAKDKKLLKRDDLVEETSTAEGTAGLLKLKEFKKFENAASALEEAAALTDGKVCLREDCWVYGDVQESEDWAGIAMWQSFWRLGRNLQCARRKRSPPLLNFCLPAL